jgi:hypothetical protein
MHSKQAAHIVSRHAFYAEVQIAKPESEFLVSKAFTLVLGCAHRIHDGCEARPLRDLGDVPNPTL